MYRADGSQFRLSLGPNSALSLAEARQMAKDALREVAHGRNPAAQKKAARLAETVSDLSDLYIDKHARPNKRTWQTDYRVVNRDIKPVWGNRKVADIKRRDVIAWVDRLMERGKPIMANRTFEVARKMFSFAVARDLIEASPFFGVAKPAPERQRERVLSEDEIRLVWTGIEAEPPTLSAIMKLRLLTAQRGGEVASMRWRDIDFNTGWWTIPAEMNKSKRTHRVPLSLPVLTILTALQQQPEHPEMVFPGRRGYRVATLWRSGDRVRSVSGVDFVPHDLRRTAASHMAAMGIGRLTIGKIPTMRFPARASCASRSASTRCRGSTPRQMRARCNSRRSTIMAGAGTSAAQPSIRPIFPVSAPACAGRREPACCSSSITPRRCGTLTPAPRWKIAGSISG
jgi:integrase